MLNKNFTFSQNSSFSNYFEMFRLLVSESVVSCCGIKLQWQCVKSVCVCVCGWVCGHCTSSLISINLKACIAAFWFDNGMSVLRAHCKIDEISLGLTAWMAWPMTPTTCGLEKVSTLNPAPKSEFPWQVLTLHRNQEYGHLESFSLSRYPYPQYKEGQLIRVSGKVRVIIKDFSWAVI